METGKKKALSTIIAVMTAIVIALFGTMIYLLTREKEPEKTDSGYCGDEGENLEWTLYESGEIVISGEGAMANYTVESPAPWYEHRATITSASVEDGVTYIGDNAFKDCEHLVTVNVSESVETMGDSAFEGCDEEIEINWEKDEDNADRDAEPTATTQPQTQTTPSTTETTTKESTTAPKMTETTTKPKTTTSAPTTKAPTTTAAASSKPSTPKEIVDYYKTAYSKVISSAKSVTRTYNNTTNYKNVLDINDNKTIGEVAKLLMNTFVKENTEPRVYSGGEIASRFPGRNKIASLNANMLSTATCTESGGNYIITLVIKSSEQSPDYGSKTGTIINTVQVQEVVDAAGDLVELEGLQNKYIAPKLIATIDKKSGKISSVETICPSYMCFSKASVAFVTINNCRVGLEYHQKWTVQW